MNHPPINQYILGLGANLGIPVWQFNLAIKQLENHGHDKIRILQKASLYQSQAHLPEDAPPHWNLDYFNTAIKIETDLMPLELLKILKNIEISIGRNLSSDRWSPRLIDLDILTWSQNEVQQSLQQLKPIALQIPHKYLLDRPFALQPVLELEPNYPIPNHTIRQTLCLKKLPCQLQSPLIMGIVNISPESFSNTMTPQKSSNTPIEQIILNHLNSGVHILDIGAESTNPNAEPIEECLQWSRLEPLLEWIKKEAYSSLPYLPIVSIDTRSRSIMKKALEKYTFVRMMNDVENTQVSEKLTLLKKHHAYYVMMHHLNIFKRNLLQSPSQYLTMDNAVPSIIEYFKSRIPCQQSDSPLIFADVGFGFNKTTEVSQLILKKIPEIKKQISLPILIGHSRKKSILNTTSFTELDTQNIKDLDERSNAMIPYLTAQGADLIRIHQYYQATTDLGFLKYFNQWTPQFSERIAATEKIVLTAEHWEIIHFLRSFYEKYHTSPAIRALIKTLRQTLGEDKGNSLYLQTLFPKSPALQAAKISGLPKPARCI